MPIDEKRVMRYYPTCDVCGWRGYSTTRKVYAERDLATHPCGQHFEIHDSTGGSRGVLGGYNRRCICGERYVSEVRDPFVCPRAGRADGGSDA